jgi:hypothetical protein
MDSNTHSVSPSAGFTALTAAVEELAAQDLDGLPDAVRAERVLVLRRLLDRLEGHWLQELAAVDARGAAGAEHDLQVGSTASWLRARLRMGGGAAHGCVRTARALFRGPLAGTARALTDGQLSPAHAGVWPPAPTSLPTRSPSRPNQCWWRRPGGWIPVGCGRSSGISSWSPTPTAPRPRPNDTTSGGGCG